MRKAGMAIVGVLLAAGLALAGQKGEKKPAAFYGKISDDMCGLSHSMGGSDRDCTLKCVGMGSKFVLADEKNQKVYKLSDQAKPRPFAGEDVKVTGTLKGDTIEVASITAAKPAH